MLCSCCHCSIILYFQAISTRSTRQPVQSGNGHSLPLSVYNNVYEPSNLYGHYRYNTGSRGDLTVDPAPSEVFSHTPSYKYDTDPDLYDTSDKFRQGSTCRVILCVILVLILIGVISAGVVLAVLCKFKNVGNIYFWREARASVNVVMCLWTTVNCYLL